MFQSRWRTARAEDDDCIVQMCTRLYIEDPGQSPIPPENIRHTLAMLRREPARGRIVVLELDRKLAGYALLIAYWSNECGGEICQVDELYVLPEHRNQGHGSALFDAIRDLWGPAIAAIAMGTTPHNVNARRLYDRLGFAEIGVTMVRRVE